MQDSPQQAASEKKQNQDFSKTKSEYNDVETYEREIKDEREIGQLHRQMKSTHCQFRSAADTRLS